ncbi:MAG: hypothetical protein ABI883_04175, partial [Chthoniobacterales bacterium]
MSSSSGSADFAPVATRPLRRVLVLADEAADWKIAGLRQLDRLTLSLQEFVQSETSASHLEVCVFWHTAVAEQARWMPEAARVPALELTNDYAEFLREDGPIDLVLSTRVFLYRESIA